MICIHCGKPIELSDFWTEETNWRHSDDLMFTCFDKDGKPIRNGEGYFRAEPKEEK
jgi:hypothetical protein